MDESVGEIFNKDKAMFTRPSRTEAKIRRNLLDLVPIREIRLVHGDAVAKSLHYT